MKKRILIALILFSFLLFPAFKSNAIDECVQVSEHYYFSDTSDCWWICTEYVCPWEVHSHITRMCTDGTTKTWQSPGPCYQ